MDAVAPLAGQIVQVLAPFLPLLLKVGEGAGGRVARDVEDKTWDVATKLWRHLGPKVDARPSAQEAAADLAANPADEDASAALRLQIRKLLADEPQLRQELEAVLNAQGQGSTTTVTASGERSVAIGRDVHGSTIITGDQPRPRP